MASVKPQFAFQSGYNNAGSQNGNVTCDRTMFSTQLLSQWHGITLEELESTHYDRHQIAMLIERKEGVSASMIENYLQNLERTLPLFQ